MKYPIGIQSFEKIRTDGYVYVDKTALVYKLATEGSYYFLRRPRRFGKSLLISTLEAYFSGRKDLFEGLAIAELEKEWQQYPILHLDLNVGQYQDIASLEAKLDSFLRPLEDKFGRDPVLREAGQRFEYVIKAAYEKLGQKLVILVDEYDKPLLSAIDDEALQNQYRTILKTFYGAMKSTDRYIRFALLTGVTKFGKVSVFSDLNNLADISLSRQYSTICGITEKEINQYFDHSVEELADSYDISKDETYERLRRRYDGYHFSARGQGVYNPFSLFNTFARSEFGSYWFETGTPTFLVQLLQRDKFYLPDLTKQEVSADFLNSVNSIDKSPVPIIYQSGYLTIKSYDERFRTYTLGFPNEEVEEGFASYLLPFYAHVGDGGSPMFIGNFVRELRNGQPQQFMTRMSSLFADTDYRVVGDAELYFQNAFYLVVKLLGFYVNVEYTISHGRIDMVVQTRSYVYIFEFKYDQSPEAALRQIDEKEYAKPFAADRRQLYKIGVSFSSEKRCISSWKIE